MEISMQVNKTKIIFLLSTMLAFFSSISSAKTCKKIGIAVQCDDGTSYRKVGNQVYGSDGKTLQAVGDGGVIRRSDGTTYKTTGSTTRGSDGTSCKKIGMTLKCEKKGS